MKTHLLRAVQGLQRRLGVLADYLGAEPAEPEIFHEHRRPNAAGEVIREAAAYWIIRHDDGTEAPYEESELRPEPSIERALTIEKRGAL